MNFEADFEQFISDLPNALMEFWHRRIRDFVNVLNVLWQRFKESQSDGELIALNNLVAEIVVQITHDCLHKH